MCARFSSYSTVLLANTALSSALIVSSSWSVGAWTTVMSLINFPLYKKCSRKALLPWQISSVHPPSLTFHNLFHQELRQRCPSDYSLPEVFMEKAKDALDLINSCDFGSHVYRWSICEVHSWSECSGTHSLSLSLFLSLSLTHTHTYVVTCLCTCT